MALEQLLGNVSKAAFMEEHFLRVPFSVPGGAAPFAELGTWSVLDVILGGALLDKPAGPPSRRPASQRSRASCPKAQAGDTAAQPDVLVVRQGRRWEEARVPAAEEARRLHEDGYTILVRHAERHHVGLAELAESFARDFHAPVDIHLYCTPGGTHGFGWHYDAEDVFILQTEGTKEYSLRKNTVNPWPLVETLPEDMRFERETMPVMKCRLQTGDWLYIPNGYWHVAEAETAAISLAVGVATRAAVEVYDFLRPRLLGSLLWRQRLPVTGEASALSRDELLDRYRRMLAELADDLAGTLRSEEFLRALLAEIERAR